MKKILSVLTAGVVLAGSLLVASCKLEESDTIANLVADQVAPLGAVANLKAEESYGTVVLTWDAVPDARAYRVVRYDKDLNAKVLPYGTVDAKGSSGAGQYMDGKTTTTKVWFLDKDVDAAGKYTYGVSALANTNPDITVAARNLYISNGPESLVNVDVNFTAVTADLVKDIKFETGTNSAYKLTIPSIALGVQYKYKLVDYTEAAKFVNDVETDDATWNTITYSTKGNHPAWTTSENDVYGAEGVQLLVAVKSLRNQDTGKWVVVNTEKTAKANIAIPGTLTLTQNRVTATTAVAKFELIVRDADSNYGTFTTAAATSYNGFATRAKQDDPTNYKYTYAAYSVAFDVNELNWKTSATPAVPETEFTLDTFDAQASTPTWGAKILTPELKSGENRIYVVTKTNKTTGKQARATIWIVGADAYTAQPTTGVIRNYKETFDFYNAGSTAVTSDPVTTGTTTTRTTTTSYNFSYIVGSDYEIVNLYRAKGTTSVAGFNSSITTEFAVSGATKTDRSLVDTTYLKEINGVAGTYSQSVATTSTYNATTGATTSATNYINYVYALVVKEKATGKYAVKYVDKTILEN